MSTIPSRPRSQHVSSVRPNASQETLRESNLALVAATVLAATDGMSRAQAAAATSLTRATVSRLVDDLIGGGILRENGKVAGAPGRPATMLGPSDRLCALGLQVNATFHLARLVTLDGSTVDEIYTPADLMASDPTEVLPRLGRDARTLLARQVGSDRRIVGAGLALPGIVEPASRTLRRAPNLGWTDVEVAPLLGLADVGLSLLGNEADLAAFSLARPAPGRLGPVTDFVYVSGEIGVGGSAVVAGEVMPGRHGWAGEIGHMCVDPSGPPCPCGSYGCLERIAGWRAFEDGAGLPHGSSVSEFLACYDSGHEGAARAVRHAAEALETALVSVVNLLDIQTIVVGGHLAALEGLVLPQVEARVGARVLAGTFDGTHVTVTPHATGEDRAPAATGAAVAVLDDVIRHPAAWIDAGFAERKAGQR